MSDKNNETTHNLTKEEIDQAFFIPKVNIPFDGKVQLSGRLKRSDKKEIDKLYTDGGVDYIDSEYGSIYNINDVHEAIKKSIDNESVDEIKADLAAYFGLEFGSE